MPKREELFAELRSLEELPALERIKRAADLMNKARYRLGELARIRAEAAIELRSTMSVAGIAEAMGVSRQQVSKIIGEAQLKAGKATLHGEGTVVDGRRKGHRQEPPWRFDFVVPDEVDFIERYPVGGDVFTDDPIPNEKLEQLRTLLRDADLEVRRVASFRPDSDGRQHVVVWTFGIFDGDTAEELGEEVTRAVDAVIPAQLVDVSQSGL